MISICGTFNCLLEPEGLWTGEDSRLGESINGRGRPLGGNSSDCWGSLMSSSSLSLSPVYSLKSRKLNL